MLDKVLIDKIKLGTYNQSDRLVSEVYDNFER